MLNIPITLDASCPEGTMFLLPPDIQAGLACLHLAAVMKAHGLITTQVFVELVEKITEHAVQAAREGRIGVVTNAG